MFGKHIKIYPQRGNNHKKIIKGKKKQKRWPTPSFIYKMRKDYAEKHVRKNMEATNSMI